jgi:mono/diheme cytochrome c family protein
MIKPLAFAAIAALALPLGPAKAADTWAPETYYADRCQACHGANGWGTRTLARRVPKGEARLTDRTRLPAPYVVYVVRHGIGSMPPFTPTELTDAQLARLAQWLERPKRASR